jgi:hypothetical protein
MNQDTSLGVWSHHHGRDGFVRVLPGSKRMPRQLGRRSAAGFGVGILCELLSVNDTLLVGTWDCTVWLGADNIEIGVLV